MERRNREEEDFGREAEEAEIYSSIAKRGNLFLYCIVFEHLYLPPPWKKIDSNI